MEIIHELPSWQEPRYRWLRSESQRGAILDVGCGEGWGLLWVLADRIDYSEPYATLHLSHNGRDVWGVDMDWDCLVRLRGRLPEGSFTYRDFTEEAIPGIELDTIICSEVMEHLSPFYVSYLLGRLYSKLKYGGKILITTPDAHADYRPECVLSANHRMLWTTTLWKRMLQPTERQHIWRITTGRALYARFNDHEIDSDGEFCRVVIRRDR